MRFDNPLYVRGGVDALGGAKVREGVEALGGAEVREGVEALGGAEVRDGVVWCDRLGLGVPRCQLSFLTA